MKMIPYHVCSLKPMLPSSSYTNVLTEIYFKCQEPGRNKAFVFVPAHPVSAGKKCGSGNYVCGLWEPYEIQLTERREAIKEKLQRIAESLNDVVLILKDDE